MGTTAENEEKGEGKEKFCEVGMRTDVRTHTHWCVRVLVLT